MLLTMCMMFLLGVAAVPRDAMAAETTWPGIDEKEWTVAPESSSLLTSFKRVSIPFGNVTDVKSSNKKVATATSGSGSIYLEYKMKIGTTKISFCVDGVPYEHTFTVKYECPFKTFKIGKTSYLNTLKKKQFYTTKKTIKNQKLTVKCKKDWVITKVQTAKNGKYKSKTYDNGVKSYTAKKFSAPQMMDGITIFVKNVKTGYEESVSFTKAYDSRYAVAG